MVRLLRHRQTKGAATDRQNLRPPRHISTLPTTAYCTAIQLVWGRDALEGIDGTQKLLMQYLQRTHIVGGIVASGQNPW
jgi:hypothetical protein